MRPHRNETEPAAVKLCTTRFEIVAGEVNSFRSVWLSSASVPASRRHVTVRSLVAVDERTTFDEMT